MASFLKVVENLAIKDDDRSVKVMIHSLSVYEQSLSPSEVVKMTEVLRNFKIEKFFDL